MTRLSLTSLRRMLKNHGSRRHENIKLLKGQIAETRGCSSLGLSNFLPPNEMSVMDTIEALDNWQGVVPFPETTTFSFKALLSRKSAT